MGQELVALGIDQVVANGTCLKAFLSSQILAFIKVGLLKSTALE